jgi:hypothetical protein
MKPNSYFVQEREPKGMNPEIEEKILKLKSLFIDKEKEIELVIKRIDSLEASKNSNLSKDELQEIQKKIDTYKQFAEKEELSTDEHNEMLRSRIKYYEMQQEYDMEESKWELIDSNKSENNGLVFDFSELIHKRVFEVEDIHNTNYYAVFYSDWAGGEVIDLVDFFGRIIVKQILDYEILTNGHIIIEANGLKDETGYEDDRYWSVIDDCGVEVVPPIKNIAIEYDDRNKLYKVGKTLYYDLCGNQVEPPIGKDDDYDDE